MRTGRGLSVLESGSWKGWTLPSVAQGRVQSVAIVILLDRLFDVHAPLLKVVPVCVNFLSLQCLHEAFATRIVVRVRRTAHTRNDAALVQRRHIFRARILKPSIGMVHQTRLRLSICDSALQRNHRETATYHPQEPRATSVNRRRGNFMNREHQDWKSRCGPACRPRTLKASPSRQSVSSFLRSVAAHVHTAVEPVLPEAQLGRASWRMTLLRHSGRELLAKPDDHGSAYRHWGICRKLYRNCRHCGF